MKHNMNMIQSSQRISSQCRQSSSQWSISSVINKDHIIVNDSSISGSCEDL